MTPDASQESTTSWPALPTETDIYILPDGQIVVADLPVELAESLAHLAALSNAIQAEADCVERTDEVPPLDASAH